ncbi:MULTISPECIES: helix-turn-helix domain-containing protein [unclassified Paenibacillus]|uniref:helix-turn-helix domain-containing protein n=1 Tax=unclassified Paenibacillus TaxID=185978 RepID=UPI00240593A1|nr:MULTISPECIES: helix-turn-helix domain-containing protein [unclassified Paenibacillus]MDF9843808.1 excisionase family DNA binding protein [Paenibacillus sp. PastF-2]MDF9850353.1 excisionase family DNA binding protein [Paenibacillus sp. PastM-2]MDF9856944.1 excisionase family DNA binding protein [Paenibacillus sp. PastF-1]MDH6482199.1 excisionase family DNA binding protein [Paenibacillus sp. PastH-2]MDH6509637.1 excisionase family DNA binding protein [Paenibacillus sp. PastM-3]
MNELINCKEAARIAGVCPRTVLRAIAAKKLAAQKIGDGITSTYLISRTALEGYLQRRGRE